MNISVGSGGNSFIGYELLCKCAHCGSESIILEDYDNKYFVICTKCGIGTLSMETMSDAINIWENRV